MDVHDLICRTVTLGPNLGRGSSNGWLAPPRWTEQRPTCSRRGGTIATDQEELKLGPRWMKFDEVSSYRIVKRWRDHLRKFWSVGGDGTGWQQYPPLTLEGGRWWDSLVVLWLEQGARLGGAPRPINQARKTFNQQGDGGRWYLKVAAQLDCKKA
jgi:hypothetical protein